MSSSQPPKDNKNPNQYVDYETDESLRYPQQQQQTSDHLNDNRGQSHGNDLLEQMYAFQEQEDADEDLPDELVVELNVKHPIQSNVNDGDESVFSDVVQDAFKKYQNEQEELLAQMEECWNYMAQEDTVPTPSAQSVGPSQPVQLNPDANEFKPSWLQSSASEASSNPSIAQEKRI